MSIKLRTRQYTDLTAWEIEEYLKNNDIIIVPVGHCEILGATPVDGEYVGAAGWANIIAEEVDGIVLPNVTFTCPGGTINSRGTIFMSVEDSMNHVKALMHSLWNQGFHRQVYIPAHGPTQQFLCAAVNAFFDESKHTVLYLDPNVLFEHCGLVEKRDIFKPISERKPLLTKSGREVQYGDTQLASYKICGRLNAVPAKGEVDFPPAEMRDITDPSNRAPWFTGSMLRLAWCCDFCTPSPFIFETDRQHGGEPVARYTREEMEIHAAIGEEYMRGLAKDADFPDLMKGLKELQKIMEESAIPKHAGHLPGNKFSSIK